MGKTCAHVPHATQAAAGRWQRCRQSVRMIRTAAAPDHMCAIYARYLEIYIYAATLRWQPSVAITAGARKNHVSLNST